MKRTIIVFIMIGMIGAIGVSALLLLHSFNDPFREKEIHTSDDHTTEAEKESSGENMEKRKLVLKIKNKSYTATLNDNSSVDALVEQLKQGSLTITMHDYAKMEKVGSIGFYLPENNENIHTEPGDLILYQGNSFVIYYDENQWELTRLGKLDEVSQEELKKILGAGDVTVELSLAE